MKIDRVEGSWDPAFTNVVDVFAETIIDDRAGAAFSVVRQGEALINVWGGSADSGSPWVADTPTVIFSCTKGIAAVVIAMLLDRGEIDSLDDPLAKYWPEFAMHGKGEISIGDALAHRAGVPGPDRDFTLEEVVDGHSLAENIAARAPLWAPGTGYSYHTLSHGALTEQLVLRTDGRSIGQFIADEIARPRNLDLWLGGDVPLARRARPVLGDIVPVDFTPAPGVVETATHFGTFGGAFPERLTGRDVGFDDPSVLSAGLAGAAGMASAHALAGFWAAVVDDENPLISPEARTALTALRGEGAPVYQTLPAPHPRWAAGVALASDLRPMTSVTAFGHDGAGGQTGFADAQHGIGVAYVTNLMIDARRADAVTAALRSALDVA